MEPVISFHEGGQKGNQMYVRTTIYNGTPNPQRVFVAVEYIDNTANNILQEVIYPNTSVPQTINPGETYDIDDLSNTFNIPNGHECIVRSILELDSRGNSIDSEETLFIWGATQGGVGLPIIALVSILLGLGLYTTSRIS